MKKLIFIAIAAILMTSCKKEKVEPEVEVQYRYRDIHYTGPAHDMYEDIYDVTYSSIVTPTIKKAGYPNTILPSKAVMFDEDINNGEFVIVQRPDFDHDRAFDLNLIYSGKSYLVDSVGTSIIYLHDGYVVVGL